MIFGFNNFNLSSDQNMRMFSSMNTIIKCFKSGLLIMATLIILSLSCNKDKTKPCLNGGYSFIVTSALSPQQEIYNIGDNMRLHSNSPKSLALWFV